MAFFTATFQSWHIAKADGHVSPEEISLANRVMNEMALTSDMRATAINLFSAGQASRFSARRCLGSIL